MMRDRWPATLDELLAEPVVPHCPPSCAFRELCPTNRQLWIADLFLRQRYVRLTECRWYERMTDAGDAWEPPRRPAA